MRWPINLVLLACVVASNAVAQQSDVLAEQRQKDRVMVRGLPGVYVLIESIDQNAQADGLTGDALRTSVELELRRLGVPVLSSIDWEKVKGHPVLYINVNTLKRPSELYVFSIQVSLQEEVTLVRRPTERVLATIWDTQSVGSVGSARLRTLRDFVTEKVQIFANLYLSANSARK